MKNYLIIWVHWSPAWSMAKPPAFGSLFCSKIVSLWSAFNVLKRRSCGSTVAQLWLADPTHWSFRNVYINMWHNGHQWNNGYQWIVDINGYQWISMIWSDTNVLNMWLWILDPDPNGPRVAYWAKEATFGKCCASQTSTPERFPVKVLSEITLKAVLFNRFWKSHWSKALRT